MEQMFFDDLASEGEPTQLEPELVESEEKERDCPVCGGSGVCSSCDRGRAKAKEFEEANKREKERKKKERRKKRR